jgi:alkanesulfonate monooxygenase SsuD/methylene tetrahydromethanopterin reductase-like flavin-dependent oxidoreductase (luciferase family)
MDIGLNLPVMVPGLDRATVAGWCRAVDQGPFSSLAVGERMNFPNPEMTVTLSAAAAWTERVQLLYNVMVMPLHHEVLAAKQIATLDVLSGGRVTVGLGVGGREEDYAALDVPYAPKTRLARLERKAARMKRIWAGEKAVESALRPVEPAPLQPGGPKMLAGSLFPQSIERAARWADGLLGFSFGMAGPELQFAFDLARAKWQEAGRPAPRLVTGTWFALGPKARDQMDDYLGRYLNFMGDAAEFVIPSVKCVDAQSLKDAVARARDLGADEVVLAPTTADVDEVKRLEDLLF